MSFSSDVKDELCGVMPPDRTGCLAEIAGLIGLIGGEMQDRECGIRTDNEKIQRKFFTLLKKAFNIKHCRTETDGDSRHRIFKVSADENCFSGMAALLEDRELCETERAKRAFLRGAFLGAGSLSDPNKYYHLEIVCPNEAFAARVREAMDRLSLPARIVKRKESYVVYMKEADEIGLTLGLMGAGGAFMKMENTKILREMRGSVNRQVNCETANLRKTVLTSLRQCRDVEYIRDHGGFGNLKPQLVRMAEARLLYPEASLWELGKMMDPPIGKSGVNHRFAKLHEIAESRRLGG
ncbi:MAG: DNA-binding protein WhiA [Lachnospiraceae bacterium]|nr:DNA-binding protein WhiA [Lachnospiraceae bacterium]